VRGGSLVITQGALTLCTTMDPSTWLRTDVCILPRVYVASCSTCALQRVRARLSTSAKAEMVRDAAVWAWFMWL